MQRSLLAILTALVCVSVARAESDVAVVVNGSPISRSAVREIVKNVVAASPDVPTSDEIGRLSERALQSLIDLELLYQEAEARRVQLKDAEVEAEIERTRKHFATEDDFLNALQQGGMTLAVLRRETRRTMLANRLLEQAAWNDIAVSPDEISQFYREHLDPGAATELKLRHILVRVPPGASAGEREQALMRAKEIRAKLAGGADFAQVAQASSDDQESASRGGSLGVVDPSAARSPLIDAAVRLREGEISDVVQSAEGYHIVQVTERVAQTMGPPSDEAKERIRQILLEQKKRQAQDEIVKELRNRAKIEYPGLEAEPTQDSVSDDSVADGVGEAAAPRSE